MQFTIAHALKAYSFFACKIICNSIAGVDITVIPILCTSHTGLCPYVHSYPQTHSYNLRGCAHGKTHLFNVFILCILFNVFIRNSLDVTINCYSGWSCNL